MARTLTIERRQQQTDQDKADAALLRAAHKALDYFRYLTTGQPVHHGEHDVITIGRELCFAVERVEKLRSSPSAAAPLGAEAE